MANRPVFVAIPTAPFYKKMDVEFTWVPGQSTGQQQKCIVNLHAAAKRRDPNLNLLEISRKGQEPAGVELSAFNLPYLRDGKEYFVECIFQGSKVFKTCGPFTDLYDAKPKDAKQDARVHENGYVVKFSLDGVDFPNVPVNYFYNWIYSKALYDHKDKLPKLEPYNAFTDIAFNPEKSLNCQARTVAIVKGLMMAGKLDEAMTSPEDYLRIVYGKWM